MVISLFEVYFLVIEHSFVKEEFKHQKARKNFPSSSWESNSRPSEFRGKFKWNWSSRWKFSGKKVIPFEVFTFYRNDRNFLFHFFFIWITSARLHVERKRKIYRYFVNGTTQSRSCFRCQKNTSTTWRKSFTGISVQMVSALECLTICICHNVDSTLSSFILGPFVLVRPVFLKNKKDFPIQNRFGRKKNLQRKRERNNMGYPTAINTCLSDDGK